MFKFNIVGLTSVSSNYKKWNYVWVNITMINRYTVGQMILIY